MAKSKLKTPDWVLKGGKKPKAKAEKGAFKVRKCPECDSDEVIVVIGDVGKWECKKCKWKGIDVKEEKMSEDEFMKYLDSKGEEVA